MKRVEEAPGSEAPRSSGPASPHLEARGEVAAEFASPACLAHEMDPNYMWAAPRRRSGWFQRVLRRVIGGRQL